MSQVEQGEHKTQAFLLVYTRFAAVVRRCFFFFLFLSYMALLIFFFGRTAAAAAAAAALGSVLNCVLRGCFLSQLKTVGSLVGWHTRTHTYTDKHRSWLSSWENLAVGLLYVVP